MLSSRVDLLPCLQKEGDGGQYPRWETKESVLLFYAFWPQGMWDLSCQRGTESASPALEDKVLTTGPPGKSLGFCC